MLDAILTERRREFAFEGQRFFDLKRSGQAIY
ncbi:RagB/SusD family nutrient uptake outer membrane protein [Thermonema sp.]